MPGDRVCIGGAHTIQIPGPLGSGNVAIPIKVQDAAFPFLRYNKPMASSAKVIPPNERYPPLRNIRFTYLETFDSPGFAPVPVNSESHSSGRQSGANDSRREPSEVLT